MSSHRRHLFLFIPHRRLPRGLASDCRSSSSRYKQAKRGKFVFKVSDTLPYRTTTSVSLVCWGYFPQLLGLHALEFHRPLETAAKPSRVAAVLCTWESAVQRSERTVNLNFRTTSKMFLLTSLPANLNQHASWTSRTPRKIKKNSCPRDQNKTKREQRTSLHLN